MSTFREMFAEVKEAAADGLTLAETGRFLALLARHSVTLAEMYETTGVAKKAFVMERIGEVIEVIVPALPLPVWLRPFAPLVRRVASSILLSIADGMVEASVSWLRRDQERNAVN